MAAPALHSSLHDTIVAQSTARGAAAIAIVRLSGPEAVAIAQALARRPLAEAHRLVRRDLVDARGLVLDEAMVVVMPEDKSATGENLVELHLHGGPAVAEAVIASCCQAGARLAGPGEFTRRAFLHGRLDLAQAEAVGALVLADTESARQAALQLLQGGLSGHIEKVLQPLESLVAQARAALDFPDDAGEAWPPAGLQSALCDVAERLADLRSRQRDVRQQAPTVVLRGPSNAGKSTLFNALLGDERALTDAAAGTTRDAVSAPWRHREVQATLWDTAGVRAQATGVEARGIARGQAVAQGARLTLWLLGVPATWPAAADVSGATLWVVGSRGDELDGKRRAEIEAQARQRGHVFAGWTQLPGGASASGETPAMHDAGAGTQALAAAVAEHLRGSVDGAAGQAMVATTARQRESLTQAIDAVQAAQAALHEQVTADCVLIDLERALHALGELIGRDVEASVLDRVFADFCIGK